MSIGTSAEWVKEGERLEGIRYRTLDRLLTRTRVEQTPKPKWRWFRHYCPRCGRLLKHHYHSFDGLRGSARWFDIFTCASRDYVFVSSGSRGAD